MENEEYIEQPYKFTKKILLTMSVVSLILTIFVFPISHSIDFFSKLASSSGIVAALVSAPLIFVSLCNLILKLLKRKLEPEEFWKFYFISWIIFACLSFLGEAFL